MYIQNDCIQMSPMINIAKQDFNKRTWISAWEKCTENNSYYLCYFLPTCPLLNGATDPICVHELRSYDINYNL